MPATRTRRRKAPGAKSKAFAAKRRAEVAALTARLDEFTADDDNAGLIAAVTAELDGYSPRNAALVAMQCPTATDISGYRQWQARGRRVARGESGIQILAPAGSREVPVDRDDPDGDTTTRQFFRLVYVFDVAQTLDLAAWDAAEAARLAGDDTAFAAALARARYDLAA